MKKISLILIYNNEEKNIIKCIESVQNQIIDDFELLCINTDIDVFENGEIQEKIEKDSRINLYNIPLEDDENSVKKSALMLANGEYVVYLPVLEYEENFISDLYKKNFLKNGCELKIEDTKFYQREFLENYEEVEKIIEEKVENKLGEFIEIVDKQKEELKENLDALSKAHSIAIDNKVYDLSTKLSNLKDSVDCFKNINENMKNDINYIIGENNNIISEKIANEVSCVYENIKAETNLKGAEISKVYEEITKNYQYTEKLNFDNKNYIDDVLQNDKTELKNKLYDLEKDIILRYVNLKRLLDNRMDEVDSRIQAIVNSGSCSNFEEKTAFVDYEKVLNESIENIYTHINSTNEAFYKELSKMYREINEKLIEKINEQEFLYNNRICSIKEEMMIEMDKKIQMLKEEIK